MVKYQGEITCPFCGHKGKDFEVQKEWTYTYLFVNYVCCPSCDQKFRINWGEREDGTKVEYTIPRSKSN